MAPQLTLTGRTVNIPIRVFREQITFLYGGPPPDLWEGTIGELIVPEDAVKQKEIVQRLQQEHLVEVMPKGSLVWFGVKPDGIPSQYQKYAESLAPSTPKTDYQFVRVQLDQPLFIRLRGSKKPKLQDCACTIPALNQTAITLNHAYTLISESFEPKRRSHTGNVFQKGYFRKGGSWWMLDHLRVDAETRLETHLSFVSLWNAIAAVAQVPRSPHQIQPSLLGPDDEALREFLATNRYRFLEAVDECFDQIKRTSISSDSFPCSLADRCGQFLFLVHRYQAFPRQSEIQEQLHMTVLKLLFEIRDCVFDHFRLNDDEFAEMLSIVNELLRYLWQKSVDDSVEARILMVMRQISPESREKVLDFASWLENRR